MRPTPLIPRTALAKKKRPEASTIPVDAIRELSKIPDLKEHFKNTTQSEKERIITFLRTFNSEATVCAMFKLNRRSVERAVNHNRDIMDNAKMARGMAIAGLAEDKAIETLRGLNVSQVPEDRKGRLVKDLMDSADIANKNVKLPSEKQEENVVDLIFRIKSRGSYIQNLVKPVNDDDIIDAEVIEQKQLSGQEDDNKE